MMVLLKRLCLISLLSIVGCNSGYSILNEEAVQLEVIESFKTANLLVDASYKFSKREQEKVYAILKAELYSQLQCEIVESSTPDYKIIFGLHELDGKALGSFESTVDLYITFEIYKMNDNSKIFHSVRKIKSKFSPIEVLDSVIREILEDIKDELS